MIRDAADRSGGAGDASSELPAASIDETWLASLPPREQALLRLILAQDDVQAVLARGPVVELRASEDSPRQPLLPRADAVEVDSGDASAARSALEALPGGAAAIVIPNALQFLTETRQFLGACFAQLAVGGLMLVAVPHQFLYERKLRTPSRRNRLHRRFYTSATLLADIEEAIDPCEYRIRLLGESDRGYDYRAAIQAQPEGGQDIVVVMEKLPAPVWRPALDQDESWTRPRDRPLRFPEIRKTDLAAVRTVSPNPHGVERLLLLKLDHRGDYLMAGQAFRTFRDAFPEAEITLVCGPWNVAEAEGSGFFDKVIAFGFFPEDDSAQLAMQSRKDLTEKFARLMQDKVYDVAVDLRLFDDTRILLKEVKALDHAGFDRNDSFPWLSIRLNTPSPTEDDRAEQRVIPASDFASSVGSHRTVDILSDERPRFEKSKTIIWGPYQELHPGRYILDCLIEALDEEFEVEFDVVADFAKRKLLRGKLPVRRADHPTVELRVHEKVAKFEFRIHAGAGVALKPFRFFGLRLVRQGVIRGVHQSEAMALLAQLVRLRMVDPYKVETT
jgi:hypothetical protein